MAACWRWAADRPPCPRKSRSSWNRSLDQHLLIGYSSTEIAGGMIVADEHVLRPPVVDYKLLDVPELGYFNTDKPYPRGELAVKSSRFMAGYYNSGPILTAHHVRRGRLLQDRRHHGRGRPRSIALRRSPQQRDQARARYRVRRGFAHWRRSIRPARWIRPDLHLRQQRTIFPAGRESCPPRTVWSHR